MSELFKKVGPTEIKPNYPKARRDESHFENFNGTRLVDPYRWLEIPEKTEVRNFARDQDHLARNYFSRCTKKKEIHTRLKNLFDYSKHSCPTSEFGNVHCCFKNDGLQNQSVLYIKDHILDDYRKIIDPNALDPEGSISIHHFAINGNNIAYAVSRYDSDWLTIRFKTTDGRELPDVLVGINLCRICWNSGNPSGIFYSRFINEGRLDGTETSENSNHKLYFHRMNTSQSEDLLVAEFPDEPHALIQAIVTSCGTYLLLSLRKQPDENRMLYVAKLEYIFKDDEDLLPHQLVMTPLTRGFNYNYDYIYNNGTDFFFRTNKNAPNYCIARTDLNSPHIWQTVLHGHPQDVLQWSCSAGLGRVFNCYIYDCAHRLDLFRLSDGTRIKTFNLNCANITEYRITPTEFYFKVESFFIPERIYRISLIDNIVGWEAKVYKKSVALGINPQDYIVRQVFFRSKDQTKIPMYIMHKRELDVGNGNTPCWLHAYGGYGTPLLPTYSPAKMLFMKYCNGIVAICNIRGGGEYGTKWHEAGMQLKKHNCFSDLEAAASFLISKKFTKHSKLVIEGHSNGGLLVATCINQRPDLFGAAIINRGILDMLRYHHFTIGRLWCGEFGNAENPKDFENLLSYSPLHNIHRPEGYNAKTPVQYPSVLVLTSDHDDRVVPLHSFKYIATLQHTLGKNPEQYNPMLMRYELGTGHKQTKCTTKMLDEMSDILCFMTMALELDFRVY